MAMAHLALFQNGKPVSLNDKSLRQNISLSYLEQLFAKLKNEVGDSEASVTDVSENRTIVRISGTNIYKLLSKFLVLDIEKNLPSELECAQTLFVKVPILLLRNHNDNQVPEIDIFVYKSHANYVYNLLVDGTENLNH